MLADILGVISGGWMMWDATKHSTLLGMVPLPAENDRSLFILLFNTITYFLNVFRMSRYMFFSICNFLPPTNSKRTSGQNLLQLFPGEMEHLTKSPGISDAHVTSFFPPQDTLAWLPRARACISLPEGFLWLLESSVPLRQADGSPREIMPWRAALNQQFDENWDICSPASPVWLSPSFLPFLSGNWGGLGLMSSVAEFGLS